jgi:poly(glycerol-phosphate) alpha-glucosyltransferase
VKVALVTAHLSRASAGVMTGVAPLARELPRHGVEPVVIGVRDERSPEDASLWGASVEACAQLGPRAFGFAPHMRVALRRSGASMVECQGLWMYPSLASWGWSRRTGRPHMISPHGMLDPWAVRRSAWKKKLVRMWFEDAHLQTAACLRALNAAEARAIRLFGLRNPIAVVPYGVDLPERFERVPSPAARTLLFLSRIDRKKGVQELVRGWALSGAAAQGWRLRIVGWGEPAYVAATARLIQELELGASVELAGPAFGEAKEEAFRSADAFILPSYSEGLPVAVLEAWSYCLPVLMTPASNMPEGFEAGAALEIGTEPAAIADGIRTLVTLSDAERIAMGIAGRRLVEARFTWPEVARQMAAVYRWVVGGGPPPACVVTD